MTLREEYEKFLIENHPKGQSYENWLETRLQDSQSKEKALREFLENCEYHPDPCNQYSFKDGSEKCTCGLDKLLSGES